MKNVDCKEVKVIRKEKMETIVSKVRNKKEINVIRSYRQYEFEVEQH